MKPVSACYTCVKSEAAAYINGASLMQLYFLFAFQYSLIGLERISNLIIFPINRSGVPLTYTHCVHCTIRNAVFKATTNGIVANVSLRNHEPNSAIRRYDTRIDSLTRPVANKYSVCPAIDV